MDKNKLKELLELYKAQPVGKGYIDIIVSRDHYRPLINNFIMSGFKVNHLSWWEWCHDNHKSKYGMGGPKSCYYKGWFAELPIDIDDIKLSENQENETIIEGIIKKIETKSIIFPNETITFKQNDWLTPAIWLDLPDE